MFADMMRHPVVFVESLYFEKNLAKKRKDISPKNVLDIS